jgi:hypothetical protein
VASIFAFKCSCCGKIHEGSPGFGYHAPDQYSSLSEQQRAEMAQINDDFCVITHEEGTDRFIRAILEVPILGASEPFLWGVWVSLSEKSFERYRDTYHHPVEGETYFGWVCNQIRLYPHTKTRAADVVVQTGGKRPKLILHRGDPEDDPLVVDQMAGISVARAQELAERAMHGA